MFGESWKYFRDIFDNAAIGKAILSPRGQWLEVNAAFCGIVGYSREELLKMTFQEITHSEDLYAHLARNEKLLHGRIHTFQLEERYYHKEGGSVWVLLTSTLIREDDGDPKYLVSEMQDITRTKQLERALRDQEEHYGVALESAETGTWELDLDTGQEVWSEHLHDLYGVSPEKVETSYDTWLSYVHPEDRERMDRSTHELIESRSPSFRNEFRIHHPERGVRWMLTKGRIFYSDANVPLRMVGTVVDISDRKRYEAEKERLANHNYALLNSTGEGIYGIDAEGHCTFINRAAAKMLGYEMDEVLGVDMHETIHHSRADGSPYPKSECPIYGAVERNVGVRIDNDVLWRKDGTALTVDYSSYPIIEEGVVTGSVVTFLDVSERKEAEQALAESEERYRRVYENAAVGVVQATTDGKVIDANERFCEFLGYRRDELLSLTIEGITHPDDIDVGGWQVDALLQGEIPLYKVDKRYVRKDASVIWVHLSVSLIRTNEGAPHYFIGVVEDVTAQREAERVLQELTESLEQLVEERTRELKASNRELEAFAYSVSHDLRAPLRSIDGFSRMMLEEYADRLDATSMRYLERIRTGARRMGDLINDLLELSRFSSVALKPKVVNLSEVAASVVASLREGELERVVEFDIEEGLKAMGDPRLLRLVLENLLGNAWKFTRHSKNARIAFESETQAGDTVYVVRDNGAGFAMDHVDRLFVPFQRLHPATEYEGSGVGLATVQRIVHRHGGRIWAEAEVGKGANFYFSLDLSSSHSAD